MEKSGKVSEGDFVICKTKLEMAEGCCLIEGDEVEVTKDNIDFFNMFVEKGFFELAEFPLHESLNPLE